MIITRTNGHRTVITVDSIMGTVVVRGKNNDGQDIRVILDPNQARIMAGELEKASDAAERTKRLLDERRG